MFSQEAGVINIVCCCCVVCAVVFMGSERYEGENTFDSFVSKHGGHSNACTDYETVSALSSVTLPMECTYRIICI